MSLQRRRIEFTSLIALTLAATVWSGSRVSGAVLELSVPQPSSAQAVICSTDARAGAPLIVIADFEEASPQQATVIENRLLDALDSEIGDTGKICRVRQVVGTRQEARALGRATRAALVVWGRSDAIFDVHVELADPASDEWGVVDRNLRALPSKELADFEYALRELDRLSFLANLMLSQVYFLNDDVATARGLLGAALARAEGQDLAQENAGSLGEAYFLLGFMLDPRVNASGADGEAARVAYSRSLELNPDLDAARLNRGNLYQALGQPDLAMADFGLLIERRGRLAADAAVNRAFLQTDRAAAERDLALAIELDPPTGYWHRGVMRQDFWDDLPGAVADFSAVVKLEPEEYFFYTSLGTAQLLAGQPEAARATYREVATRLNETSLEEVMAELEGLARDHPELAAAIAAILADLRAAPIPISASVRWV